jgi:hypothetical protein
MTITFEGPQPHQIWTLEEPTARGEGGKVELSLLVEVDEIPEPDSGVQVLLILTIEDAQQLHAQLDSVDEVPAHGVRLLRVVLKQIEFAAKHEIEAAGAPLSAGLAHQRRLFSVAPDYGIRPLRCERCKDFAA